MTTSNAIQTPASFVMNAKYVTAIATPSTRNGNCLAVVNIGGDRAEFFRVQPLDLSVVRTLPCEAVVGLLVGGKVIWCQVADVEADDQFELHLVAVPASDVITANVRIVIPQATIGGQRIEQLIRHVAVEGPAEKVPPKLVVTGDELLDKSVLTVGELRLPAYCETIGNPLTETVAVIPTPALRATQNEPSVPAIA